MIEILDGDTTHPAGPAGPRPGGPPPPPPKATGPDGPIGDPKPEPGPPTPRASDPTGEPAPGPVPFPPPPVDDPTCLRCGGYFTAEQPHRARGLHAACYVRAWHRFEIDQYPLTDPTADRRFKNLPPPNRCGHCGQADTDCVDAARCPRCVVGVRLLVSSAMRGETAARHCPHLVAA